METRTFNCKICQNKNITSRYCSISCARNDPEFITLCETVESVAELVRKTGLPETSLRRLLKEFDIHIKFVQTKKPPKIKTCPKCGKEHTAKYGVHCSYSCANGRVHTEETKFKISKSLEKTYAENPELSKIISARNEKLWKTEEYRNKKINRLIEYWKPFAKSDEEKRVINRLRKLKYDQTLKSATPDNANIKLIDLIYKYRPEGYHVDHIIPISKGGLHHEDNLQYLTAEENLKKNNKLDYVPQGAIRWQDLININTDFTNENANDNITL